MNLLRSRIVHSSTCLWILALLLATASAAQSTPAPEAPRPPRAPRAATPSPAPPAPPAAFGAPGHLQAPQAPQAPRAPRLSGGYLGVEIVDLTPELREHFGAPRGVGVMVGRVAPGSPAARAGLAVADVVTRIGDQPVHDSWGFAGEVSSREGGERLTLAVVRAGRERAIEATLERRERDAVDIGRWIFPPTPPPGAHPPGSAPSAPSAPGAPGATPFPEMGPAFERLGRLLESPDFKEQLKATQLRIDAEVEQRMKELEVRLQELEKRLQEGGERR